MLSRGLLVSLSQHSNVCVLHPQRLLQFRINCCSCRIGSYHLLSKKGSCSSVSSTSIAAAAAGASGAESAAGTPVPRRRRKKLFYTDSEDVAPATAPQQQQQQQDGATSDRQRPTPPDTQQWEQPEQPKQQQQRLAINKEQQKQQGWWDHPAAASDLLVHVFWDLDNLKPVHWNQAEELVGTLKAALRLFGRLQSLQAYANSRTLISTVEVEGIEGMLEDPDELRCPMCGRRCESFDDLQKHFKQLHEREHQKKMRGPKKFVAKYVKSDKAQRVRDAGRFYGTPKKNRSGRRGQMVKVILQRAGVKVIEVASQKQAADDAINRHMDSLVLELKSQDQQPMSHKTEQAEAAGGVPPWRIAPYGASALQQSVLAIVSDDRGFASSVARWLQHGGVGAVLVTTRGSGGWEQPLTKQLGAHGNGRSCDVLCISWGDLIAEVDESDSSSTADSNWN